MLQSLKERVYRANLRLVQEGLVVLTWGNASGIDRENGLMVIKPSGVEYEEMKPEDMVVVSLQSGEVLHGDKKPSSDTPTHLELYRSFTAIGGIVHSHSLYATSWAQARREIPPLGTTHADHFYGPVRCTRDMRRGEITDGYEENTGRVIVETFRKSDPMSSPGVLVAGHGPFVWGTTIEDAARNAVVLERVARMASETLLLNRTARALSKELQKKHYFRKHGPGAYYGQRKKS